MSLRHPLMCQFFTVVLLASSISCSRGPTASTTSPAPAPAEALAPAANPAPAVSPADLQGSWKLVKMERNGEAMDISENYATRGLKFAGGRVLLLDTEKGTETDTGLAITAHDPTKTPKQFDLTRQSGTQAGKVLPSIYAVKGDELLIMLGKNGKERPADFDTQKIRGIEKETYLRMNK